MSRGRLTADARRLTRIKEIKAHILARPAHLFPVTQRGVGLVGNATEIGQAFRELVAEGLLVYTRGVGYTRP